MPVTILLNVLSEVFIFALAVPIGILAFAWLLTLPDVQPLAQHNPTSTALIEHRLAMASKQGRAASKRWNWVPLARISSNLQRAVIAAEDASFLSHEGFDWDGIKEAAIDNLESGAMKRGGSTITQQLAKNLFLSPKKTIWRKLYEAELALLLELRYSKKQILGMYLNKIYFGQEGPRGVYGIEEASEFYFSKQAKDISLEESALLAGIIRSPNRYSLLRDPKTAKERRTGVLTRMRELEMIGEDEFRRASNASADDR